MKRLKRHVVRLRVRLAGMSTAARVTAGILTSGILGGAVWLLWAIVTPEPMVTLCNELNDAARDQAITALEREGIGYRRTVSGLQVSPSRLSDARKVLRTQPTGSKSSSSGLSGLASSSSMWRSSAENRRLWQAGVMAELGRMITEMDPVASASVLFEPGCNGGLGVKARVSRAAVKVTLAKGRRMSPALIVAIGELVSGSVAVEIGDVRVIDQTGRSYRPSSDVRAFALRNAFESHYSDKIISALRYIPGISVDVKIVTVRSESKKSVGENMRVWVSVPRSYLESVLSEGGQSAASRQLASVKDAARAVLSPGGNHDINVVLHGPANTANSDGAKTSAGIGGGMFLVAMLAAVLVGGLGFWLLTRYRGLVVLKPRSVALPTSDESSDALDYEMLGRFSSVCSDDTGNGFDGEHPQTLALMLVRIPSAQAAEIMVRLPSELRAEVARRISDLDDADPDVLAEIRRDLARRTDSPEVTTLSGNDESGNGDYQRAERDALRLLAFEDIMLLGAGELRVAMGAVEPDDLAISLRMAARPVRRKVLGCLSSRDAEYVQTRMDRIGPMRICDVESARQRVMKTVSQAAGPARRSGQTTHGDALEEAV